MYLMQQCKSGIVLREFTGRRIYKKGEHKTPECRYTEIRRVLYDKGVQNPRAYYWGQYRQRNMRWIIGCLRSPSGHYWYNYDGKTYGKTLPGIVKREVSLSVLVAEIKRKKLYDPEDYLAVYQIVPQIEKIAKANLPILFRGGMKNYTQLQNAVADNNAGSLVKILGIDKQQLKRLRNESGDYCFLAWLRHEKSKSEIIDDDLMRWLCRNDLWPRNLDFILDKMTAMQVYNYLNRQMSQHHTTLNNVLIKWKDYLSMAKRLKMDTSDAIVYRVNKLYQRHDELVKLLNEKDFELQVEEYSEKYPHVNEVCKSIKEKYEYANDIYTIRVPSCIEDIMREGRNLTHCAASSERYWERIERREAYILFLRHADNPEKSYYTLEVEPGGTVRQKRTYFDRQEADIEDATLFLKEWQNVISARITSEDKELATESRNLRNVEFAELRKNRAIIRTGDLAGQLLVDVLMADLLENVA